MAASKRTHSTRRPAAKKARGPSPGRVQDWIVSVLNPIIEGLRNEGWFLQNDAWHWSPTAREFEHLAPVSGRVSVLFSDNLDDFLHKNPEWQDRFDEHDRLLTELGERVAATYDRLMGPDGDQLRGALEFVLKEKHRSPDDVRWFFGYVASDLREAPDRSTVKDLYESNLGLRARAEEIAREETAAARATAKRLLSVTSGLLDGLIELRGELADDYGVRIKPVS